MVDVKEVSWLATASLDAHDHIHTYNHMINMLAWNIALQMQKYSHVRISDSATVRVLSIKTFHIAIATVADIG